MNACLQVIDSMGETGVLLQINLIVPPEYLINTTLHQYAEKMKLSMLHY